MNRGFEALKIISRLNEGVRPEFLLDRSKSVIEDLRLPDRRHEDWKYTDVTTFFDGQFVAPTPVQAEKGNLIEFCDGQLISSPVSNTSIRLTPFDLLTESDIESWKQLRKELNHWQSEVSVENLNLAASSDGILISVLSKSDVTLRVRHWARSNVFSSPRIIIHVEQDASVTLLEEFAMSSAVNSFTDCKIEARGKLNYVRVQGNEPNATQLSTLRVKQESYSNLNYFNFSVGSNLSRENVCSWLSGEGSTCHLYGLSVQKSGQHSDQFVFVDHGAPNCESTQLFKSIVGGKSRAIFKGRILVRPGSSGTKAYQLNKSLLLGDKSEVDTRPQLEIFNDDVKCSHGATVGRIDEEQFFYLVSRGISPRLAMELLCKGFAEDIIQKAPIDLEELGLLRKLSEILSEAP